ncbi:hypothetical protein RZS08_26140, partial [Arthrospira platensis SPKY1]|nr:hypothetical protein [Arthrospira platensis SPKY1]
MSEGGLQESEEDLQRSWATVGRQEHPAIVGRQVGGYSVVAVVSRGRDDRGRSVSLYRYFWCEGKDYIEAILRMMISR